MKCLKGKNDFYPWSFVSKMVLWFDFIRFKNIYVYLSGICKSKEINIYWKNYQSKWQTVFKFLKTWIVHISSTIILKHHSNKERPSILQNSSKMRNIYTRFILKYQVSIKFFLKRFVLQPLSTPLSEPFRSSLFSKGLCYNRCAGWSRR